MAKNPIPGIIEAALEQDADLVDAVYDYFDETGSAGRISYEQAQYIVTRFLKESGFIGKLCPFCGYVKLVMEEWKEHEEGNPRVTYAVYAQMCMNCGAMGPPNVDKLGAEEAWRSRAE